MKRTMVLLLLAALILTACSKRTAAPTPAASVTTSAPAASTAPAAATGTIAAAQTSAKPDDSVDRLLALIHDTDPQTDTAWVRQNYLFPAHIEDFGHSSDIDPKYVKDDLTDTLAYIEVNGANAIGVDDVVLQKNGSEDEYTIVNEKKGYVSTPVSSSLVVLVNFEGTDIRYTIPFDFLSKQLDWKKNNLYHVYTKDGAVQVLMEQYRP